MPRGSALVNRIAPRPERASDIRHSALSFSGRNAPLFRGVRSRAPFAMCRPGKAGLPENPWETGVRKVLRYLAAALAALLPTSAFTQGVWEYRGVTAGYDILFSDPHVLAVAPNTGAGTSLAIECRRPAPDYMLPARITFVITTPAPDDSATDNADEMRATIRVDGAAFSLKARSRPGLLGLLGRQEVITEWEFADASMPAAQAVRKASGPIEVEVAGTRGEISSEGAAQALDQLLVRCGAAERSGAVIGHLRCAADYWTLGALRPDLQPATTPRVQLAARAHFEDRPDTTDADLRAELEPRVQARGQQILAQEEPLDALVADTLACDAQYGMEPLIPLEGDSR